MDQGLGNSTAPRAAANEAAKPGPKCDTFGLNRFDKPLATDGRCRLSDQSQRNFVVTGLTALRRMDIG